MDILTTILISVGLAMDAFAVSIGVGTTGRSADRRAVFRLAFHFGLFQGLMTFLGWLAGTTIASLIAGIDHWVAMGLLAWVGVRMILQGLSKEEERDCPDPSRGGTLMMLCIATSLDAMAVGLSLAMINVDILSASLSIGFITLGLSLLGLLLGSQLGKRFGKRMEVLGGILLNLIGLRILLSHLLPALEAALLTFPSFWA